MRQKRKAGLLAALALVLILAPRLPAQAVGRALDNVTTNPEDVLLVVFNPEPFNIRALQALRDTGILDIPNLVVIGVLHAKQRSTFAASLNIVTADGLEWFRFHGVEAEISEPVLYRKNACTPEFEKIFKKADGIIFFGGPDIPPSTYGEKTNLLTEISDPYRHYLESSAVFHLLGGLQDNAFPALLDARPDFPLLGICLGMQTLNVGTGGTLVQDIWSEAYARSLVEDVISLGPEQWHTNPYPRIFPTERLGSEFFHSLQLGSQSLFCRAMGFKAEDHPKILSAHHQALEKLGKGLVPTATSRDGKIIEAVEHKRFSNVLGLQFHPEHRMLWDPEPRSRWKPGDPPTSFLAVLEGAPPSVDFHKKIWSWFGERLIESHNLRKGKGLD